MLLPGLHLIIIIIKHMKVLQKLKHCSYHPFRVGLGRSWPTEENRLRRLNSGLTVKRTLQELIEVKKKVKAIYY